MPRGRFVAGAAALAAAGVPAAARAQFGQTQTAPVMLGVVAPFTGDRAAQGQQLANGVQQALDDANQTHFVFDRTFSLRAFDDQDSPTAATVSAQFACDDPSIVCTIGHLSGRVTLVALPTYANRGMPLVIPVSTYDPLTRRGYGNLVRMTTKDSMEGQLHARYVKQTVKPAHVASVSLDADYGPDVAAGFDRQIGNDKIDCRAIRLPVAKPDFLGSARGLAADKPDAVFLAGLASQLADFVTGLRSAGYTGPLFASQGFFDGATLRIGAPAEGIVVSTSMPPLQNAPSTQTAVNNFQSRYGQFIPIAAFGYAAAQIAMQAVRRSLHGDRASVLRTFGVAQCDTIVGSFSFASLGDPTDPNLYYYTLRNGKWSYLAASHPEGFLPR
jgi:branched-chain amino acid transport system substrate-binding protein